MPKTEILWFSEPLECGQIPVCSLCSREINELIPVIIEPELYKVRAFLHKECYFENKETLNLDYGKGSKVVKMNGGVKI